MFPKQKTVVLTGQDYVRFKNDVHEADSWRCGACHGIKPLQVHHLQKRSHGRLDTKENCVSLCAGCHSLVETYVIRIEWQDVTVRKLLVIRP